MFKSLKARLILSHILPLLVVILAVGFALTYLLETQVLLARLSNELELQATLVAEAARQNPLIWYEPLQASLFVQEVGSPLSASIMLLSPTGQLLATNDSSYSEMLGETLSVPGLSETVSTGKALRVNYGERPGIGSAEVLMPVIERGGEVIGVIRLIDPLSSVYQRFPRTRALILGVLAAGLFLGAAMGWVLASDLTRPLQRATQGIARMADGHPLQTLPEQGPSEIRMLLRAFNTLTQQLRDLEKSRTRLLANLVHELGRPLGALLSATQALSGGAYQDPEFRGELLDGMQSEIQRMHHLLDDLTRLYDQSQGPLVLNRARVETSTWLAQTMSPWRQAAQEKGVQWIDKSPADLPALNIDADRMAQALGNIISNAIKYTPSEGAVTIESAADAKHLWIAVRDTGIGIPEEELAAIFEPFYRGSTSRRFPQGMGVGLSIAKELVTAHGGHIDVTSEVGKGSQFTIWLPRGAN